MSAGDVVRFIRTWSTTGAIAPSGRALARRMVAEVDPLSSEPILELGPGTGVVTRALLERGVVPGRIIAVEYNPEFCRLLAERCPGIRIVEGDAYDLGKTLADVYTGPFAAAVSSLPLLLRPPEQRMALVRDVLSRLVHGGSLAQFSYSPKPPVPPSPQHYRLDGSGWIVMNMPPARVWTYRPLSS